MGENRSLDDFFSGTDEDRVADENEGDGDDDSDGDDAPDAGAAVDEGDAGESPTTSTTPHDVVTGDDVAASDQDTDGDADAMDHREAGVGGADTDTDAAESLHPLRATYRWSPDGDDCPACGRHVERRWRDDDRFVCADCKEW